MFPVRQEWHRQSCVAYSSGFELYLMGRFFQRLDLKPPEHLRLTEWNPERLTKDPPLILCALHAPSSALPQFGGSPVVFR